MRAVDHVVGRSGVVQGSYPCELLSIRPSTWALRFFGTKPTIRETGLMNWRRGRSRSRTGELIWSIWPSFPVSWSEVPARIRPAVSQITRLTAAAVIAYLVANSVSPGILDLTAPLTALLVVQASTVGTLLMGLVRVGAVLTGVLVAVGIASSIGLSSWSLALVIAASLVLA